MNSRSFPKWYRLIMSGHSPHEPCLSMLGRARLFGETYHTISIPDGPFLLGRTIDSWNSVDSFVASDSPDTDGTPDDVLFSFWASVPMFSPKLYQALVDHKIAQTGVQYLPIRVFQSNGREESPFWLANILTRLKGALNAELSERVEYKMSDDPERQMKRISVVGAPVLIQSVVGQFEGDAFRLDDYPQDVFVSERMARLISEGGFSGATLSAVKFTKQSGVSG